MADERTGAGDSRRHRR